MVLVCEPLLSPSCSSFLLFPHPKTLRKSTFPLTVLYHLIEIYFLKEVLFQKEIGKGGKGSIEMEEGKDIEKEKND